MIHVGWHASQSRHNRSCSHDLSAKSQNRYLDWEITILFYSALHIVNEYFSQKNIPVPTDHIRRRKQVKEYLGPIYAEYQQLYTLSIRTRYNVSHSSITQQEVHKANICFDKISSYLNSSI